MSIESGAGSASGSASASGTAPNTGGPFFFAWCDATDTTFGPAFHVYDEPIFSFSFKAEEGQACTLEIEVANPWIDAPTFKYIAPGNHYWAWFSWYNPLTASVEPLFFGRLVGMPDSIEDYTVKLQFIARSDNWIAQRQALAESLKVSPFYDPVFLDDAERDSLDAILEAYSALPHIDPLTHAWAASDILDGEDGTIVFDASDVLWGVKSRLAQTPLQAVNVQADVNWSQIDSGGSIWVGTWVIDSYGGASIISEWPKVGTSIGGGWTVQAAGALDLYNIDSGSTITYSGGFRDEGPRHNDGDAISGQGSMTIPATVAPGIEFIIREDGKGAIIGDDYSDPSANYSATYGIIPLYRVPCWLYLQYEADRKRSEQVNFTLTADLQPTTLATTRRPEVETLKLSSVDLSKPMWLPRSRALFDSTSVALGQVIKPSNPPTGAGSLSYQICVNAGTCASSEPDYSGVIGDSTADGTAAFACIGSSLPEIGEWQPSTAISLGTVIAPVPPLWVWRSAILPPAAPYRTAGGSVSAGQIIRDDFTFSFQYCTLGGETSFLGWPSFSPIYGVPTVDGSAVFVSLGMFIPGGAFQICTTAGVTGLLRPPFSPADGVPVLDGTAVWTSLGAGGPSITIPAGGVPGRVTARSWFPSNRGVEGLEYLIMRARAMLRSKARAIETEFQCPFHVAASLSTRKSGTVPAPGKPGGEITGKIVAYELTGDGATGEFLAHVKLGSAVGNGGTASAVGGTGVYAASGYMAAGYQQMSGAVAVIGTSDVGYSRPTDAPNDDGLTFPITREQVINHAVVVGSLANQRTALNAAIPNIKKAMGAQDPMDIVNFGQPVQDNRAIVSQGPSTVDAVLGQFGNSIYVDIELKPVTGQSFTKVYSIETTSLSIPKHVEVAA